MELCKLLPEDKHVWLMIDALDQLDNDSYKVKLAFLPFSYQVSLFVTAKDFDPVNVSAKDVEQMPVLSRKEIGDVLSGILDRSQKHLFVETEQAVREKSKSSATNLFYLQLVAQELLLISTTELMSDAVKKMMSVKTIVEGKIFCHVEMILVKKVFSMCKKFLISCLAKILLLAIIFASPKFANAAGEKIIFIPHDDRPVSYLQTVEVIEKAGYEMILSPKDLLNGSDTMGEPDKLWKWFAENAPSAKSAVVASDSLLYGGLIPSRKHEVPQEVLDARLAEFEKIRRDNPNLKIYVFDSLMRTPQIGFKGNIEEPKYYETYGADIFRLSELNDKKELYGLTADEEKEIVALEKKIPADAMKDWF